MGTGVSWGQGQGREGLAAAPLLPRLKGVRVRFHACGFGHLDTGLILAYFYLSEFLGHVI